jgi:hypothetical protein
LAGLALDAEQVVFADGVTLRFQPIARLPAPVNAVPALRNHSFKPGLIDKMENCRGIAWEGLAELDAATLWDHCCWYQAPVLQRQILVASTDR